MDLETRWKHFQTAAAARGLRIYPGLPRGLDQGVFWQGDPGSFEDFLELAQAVGARIVYALAERWDPEGFLEDLVERPLPEDLQPQVKALEAEARARAGELAGFIAAWIHEGQAHVYMVETDWAADLRQRKEALLEMLENLAKAEKAEEAEALEAIARKLAENREFQQARSYETQIRIAQRLFPELRERWSQEESAYSRWWDLVRDARAIYEAEILPRQEQRMAEEAARLLALGLSRTEAAARLGISRGRLDRLLQRYTGDENHGSLTG